MSSGYLQRLLDRAAHHQVETPPIIPSGISTSPVALSDQRLNNPDLAADFSFGSVEPDGMHGETPSLDSFGQIPAQPTALWPPVHKAARSVTTDTRPTQKPAVSVSPGLPDQPPPLNRHPRFIKPMVGEVFEADFVPPELGESREESFSSDNKPSAAAQARRQAMTEPHSLQSPVMAGPGQAAAVDSPKEAEPPPELDVYPERLRADATETAELSRAEPLTPEPVEQESPLVQEDLNPPPPFETRRTLEVFPSPVYTAPPASAAKPSLPEPGGRASEPETQVAEKSPEPQVVPEGPKTVRPMTASEASLIGPIEQRPRAITLFGMRRR